MSFSRTKLKQADWPLCSKSNVEQDLKQTRRKSHHKITILPTRSSGKCKIQKQNISQVSPLEKHVCDTCKQEISDISRVLLMRDKDGGPRVLCFHFFFPCWDMDLLIQKYPNLKIDNGGFDIPENIKMNEISIKDLQTNLEFWT